MKRDGKTIDLGEARARFSKWLGTPVTTSLKGDEVVVLIKKSSQELTRVPVEHGRVDRDELNFHLRQFGRVPQAQLAR